jgi:Protein of unknown function (DUF2786)
VNDLAGTMRRISGLLAKADSTEFPEEAASLRAKAEELIARYRIEEEDLIATADAGAAVPVSRIVVVADTNSEFKNYHYWIWNAVARHCEVRFDASWKSIDGKLQWAATVVGYDVDIRLAEMLYNSARLVFGAHLEPSYDASETDAENVYRMRNAGMERNRIANILWRADVGSAGAVAHGRVAKLYKAECERRGEDPRVTGRKVNAKTYRLAYAEGFTTSFSRRLREARDAADAVVGAIVSPGRAARVEEAFYDLFPYRRPNPEAREEAKAEATSRRKERRITKAEAAKFNRLYYGQAAERAHEAAREAAAKVLLDRPQRAPRAGAGPDKKALED